MKFERKSWTFLSNFLAKSICGSSNELFNSSAQNALRSQVLLSDVSWPKLRKEPIKPTMDLKLVMFRWGSTNGPEQIIKNASQFEVFDLLHSHSVIGTSHA